MGDGMTEERLNEIDERLLAATPGPWEVSMSNHDYEADRPIVTSWKIDWPRCTDNRLAGLYGRGRPRIQADAEFIANSPVDITDLLAEVNWLRNELHEQRLDIESLLEEVEEAKA